MIDPDKCIIRSERFASGTLIYMRVTHDDVSVDGATKILNPGSREFLKNHLLKALEEKIDARSKNKLPGFEGSPDRETETLSRESEGSLDEELYETEGSDRHDGF